MVVLQKTFLQWCCFSAFFNSCQCQSVTTLSVDWLVWHFVPDILFFAQAFMVLMRWMPLTLMVLLFLCVSMRWAFLIYMHAAWIVRKWDTDINVIFRMKYNNFYFGLRPSLKNQWHSVSTELSVRCQVECWHDNTTYCWWTKNSFIALDSVLGLGSFLFTK